MALSLFNKLIKAGFMRGLVSMFVVLLLGLCVKAQQLTTFSFPDFPVEFDYPNEFVMEKSGKKSWLLYDKNVGTEFNINLYKVSPRFTSDSLRYLMLRIYDDPSISNLQVSESGSGTMGQHRAEKLSLSFMTQDDKRYISTIYLVYFYVNQSVNCMLFFFEIGERNVASYAPIQENMISSLRYKPFRYKKYQHAAPLRMSIEYPDFWSAGEMQGEANFAQIHDGRCFVNFSHALANDSISLKSKTDAERDVWKKNTSKYPAIKIKTLSMKGKSGEIYYQHSGTYDMELFSGVKREMAFKKFIFRRVEGNMKVDYEVMWEYPVQNELYYSAIMDIMMESLELPGTPDLVEKNK